MTAAQQNFRVQFWITVLSVVLFFAKIIAFYFTHSLAILSDALESIVNVIAGFIGLYSLYIAAKPRDLEHPYGHGKAEFVSAAFEGGLIVAAGILIIYETVTNILRNEPIHQLDTGLWLIGATALINFAAGSICLRIGKKNHSLALQASGKHLQIDTYSTLAIIAGLIIILLTKLYWLDKVIAFGMSLLIIYNGYKIIRSSLAGIMDEADMEILSRFIEVLNNQRNENWVDLHNLRVIKYGSLLHVDCHLTVPWYLNIHEAHKEIDDLSALIRQEFGDSIELFVHTDGCLPFSCRICNKACHERQHPFEQKIKWTLENILSDKKHQL
ncbi:cation diffusion facilitator family transporter [Sediminibacterium goheungense]|uniref:Cation diffusion facilitator family transporter n=1 Tax=Sediminibacterium goheungense TaxID=1086393 RepID=A0A4R6IVW0_9BACT|nr:cation diffusion facilitator family transporter [Sediminibacterium goheungense]TDO26814.1 cation diffusion facilitator family transporter [Sediminibacterium goheungense]